MAHRAKKSGKYESFGKQFERFVNAVNRVLDKEFFLTVLAILGLILVAIVQAMN